MGADTMMLRHKTDSSFARRLPLRKLEAASAWVAKRLPEMQSGRNNVCLTLQPARRAEPSSRRGAALAAWMLWEAAAKGAATSCFVRAESPPCLRQQRPRLADA